MATKGWAEQQSGTPRQSAGAAVPKFVRHVQRPTVPSFQSFKRMVRRGDLRKIVPLADTTIYEMEQRGEFPRRFQLTPRCVAWDLAEVEAWLEARRPIAGSQTVERAPPPNVRLRKTRPVT